MTINKKVSFAFLIITIILWVYYMQNPEVKSVKVKNTTPIHYIWNKDSKQIYNLKTSTIFLKNNKQSFRLNIESILNFRVYEVQKDAVKVGFELSNIVYTQHNHSDEEYAKVLSTLVLAKMQKNGHFIEFYFPNTLASDDEILIKNIILNFATTLNGEKDYTVIESDFVGEYEAKYSIQKDKILREKLQYYFKNDIDSSFGTVVKMNSSKTYIKLSKNQSWLNYFNMNETGRISGKIINNEFINHSSLEESKYSQDNSLLIWQDYSFSELLKLFEQNKKNKISYQQKLDDKIDKREFISKKITFKNVLDDLIQSIKNKKNLVSAREEIVKYMRLFPQSILELQSMLENGEFNDKESSTLITLLAISGTKEAQTSLLNILNSSSYEHVDSVRAAMALSRIEFPQDETINNLINIYENMSKGTSDELEKARTTVLALGRLSNSVDDALKSKIYDSLSKSLDEDTTEKDAIIYAIGNSDEISFVDDIVKYTNSDSVTTRIAVYSTLGKLKTKEGEIALINSIEKENSTIAKNTIVSSLLKYEKNDATFKSINELVQKEDSLSTRTLMIKYLEEDTNHKAQTIETFKTLIKQENSKVSLKIMLKTLKENKQ